VKEEKQGLLLVDVLLLWLLVQRCFYVTFNFGSHPLKFLVATYHSSGGELEGNGGKWRVKK
jgi:hypothetical protein